MSFDLLSTVTDFSVCYIFFLHFIIFCIFLPVQVFVYAIIEIQSNSNGACEQRYIAIPVTLH